MALNSYSFCGFAYRVIAEKGISFAYLAIHSFGAMTVKGPAGPTLSFLEAATKLIEKSRGDKLPLIIDVRKSGQRVHRFCAVRRKSG